MTAERIAELRRLLAEATPGPWGVKGHNVWVVDEHGNPAPRTGMRPCGDSYPRVVGGADYGTTLECIAAAHNALPELLDAAEAYIRLTQEGDAGMMERLQKFAALAIEKQRVVNDYLALQDKCDALEAACERKDALLREMSAVVALHDQNDMLEEVGKR